MRPGGHRVRSHPRGVRSFGSSPHPSSCAGRASHRDRRRGGCRVPVRHVPRRLCSDRSSGDRPVRAHRTAHHRRNWVDPWTRSGSPTNSDRRSPGGRRCGAAPRRARPSSRASRSGPGPRRAAAHRCDSRCSTTAPGARPGPPATNPGIARRSTGIRPHHGNHHRRSHRCARRRCANRLPHGIRRRTHHCGCRRCRSNGHRSNRCARSRTRCRATNPTASRRSSGRRRARSRRNGRSCWDAGAR